ncbi:hypothetical protein U9M48_040903 [Paspalum notatum var. saurae]|uniref:NAC domain-containing protein n=1 Tax=Paspalum notatum var. saurae TaxID=547442 RepID=A0AAQ3UMN3_PASNO
MQQPPVTDAELADALARRRRGLPPAPSQSFTVNDHIFLSHPSRLYDEYGGGAGREIWNNHHGDGGWKVAGGTQRVFDAGGGEVAWKDTLVFHEGLRWRPRTRWAVDEFREFNNAKYDERVESDLYGLHLVAGEAGGWDGEVAEAPLTTGVEYGGWVVEEARASI